jgi:hypothetical protein
MASGKNIRTARTPMPLTKMMAHHFLEAPATASIEGAFRWGEVHALGGDATLTHALLGTRLGNSFDHHEASYARSCATGSCSIWAMEVDSPVGQMRTMGSGSEKSQTIEVTKAGVIVQCRGRLNRLPTASEFEIVRRWADVAGLTISPYVRAAG